MKKDEWESTKDAKKFSLEAGTYTFQETVAPTGYEKVDTEIEFTVSIEGKVTVNSASGSVEQKADVLEYLDSEAQRSGVRRPLRKVQQRAELAEELFLVVF